MNYLDYSKIKDLIEKYIIKYSRTFSALEKDLSMELKNCIENLDSTSVEIVDILHELFSDTRLVPNENDEIEIMGFKLKLKRADPNIPIELDNATIAYSKGYGPLRIVKKDKENKLERLSIEFYRTAHRIIDITEKLPECKNFKAHDIRIIRNNLIDHPEGKGSGITHDSFSYSKNEGPYIKGLRIGNQLKHRDKGFKINSENFINELFSILSTAVN